MRIILSYELILSNLAWKINQTNYQEAKHDN